MIFLSKADLAAVAVDGASGQQLLADAMKAARIKAPVLPTVKQIITANAAFEQAVFARSCAMPGSPALRRQHPTVKSGPSAPTAALATAH